MIEFYEVSKTYLNGVTALRDVTITIAKGEFVFVVGLSGAGKSTLARLVYREELPTKGYVFVNGVNLARLKPRAVPYLRRNIGVVFQDFKLLPRKTAYENVAFALRVTGASPREIARRVPACLELVGLGGKGDAYPDELSGGEQQRTALARAIANHPLVLVADEPTGNLDPTTSWDIVRLLLEVNQRGTTVLMATHAKHIVDAVRRRVITLDKGLVVSDKLRGGYGDGGERAWAQGLSASLSARP
ncbi:MAG: cell division ATP-binding protein FtsE [Bacillota bacterium]|nr:MAG: cell division ATP-binding protein FtsE [Bacillota bacterium]